MSEMERIREGSCQERFRIGNRFRNYHSLRFGCWRRVVHTSIHDTTDIRLPFPPPSLRAPRPHTALRKTGRPEYTHVILPHQPPSQRCHREHTATMGSDRRHVYFTTIFHPPDTIDPRRARRVDVAPTPLYQVRRRGASQRLHCLLLLLRLSHPILPGRQRLQLMGNDCSNLPPIIQPL